MSRGPSGRGPSPGQRGIGSDYASSKDMYLRAHDIITGMDYRADKAKRMNASMGSALPASGSTSAPPAQELADLPYDVQYGADASPKLKKIATQVGQAKKQYQSRYKTSYMGTPQYADRNASSGSGARGGYGNSYGSGGYQGGTYGGAAGRAINEGVGQAYKNR